MKTPLSPPSRGLLQDHSSCPKNEAHCSVSEPPLLVGCRAAPALCRSQRLLACPGTQTVRQDGMREMGDRAAFVTLGCVSCEVMLRAVLLHSVRDLHVSEGISEMLP